MRVFSATSTVTVGILSLISCALICPHRAFGVPGESDWRPLPAVEFQPQVPYTESAFSTLETLLAGGSIRPPLSVALSPQAPSPANGKIAFASTRDGNDEIYAMNTDGTNVVRLTNNPASDTYPKWSPDGTKIVFASSRDGNYEIYVMNADGTNQTRLTNNPLQDHYPAWSPDGSKITFASDRDGNREIYVMNADGSGQTRLTNNTATDSQPYWSPDGTKLVFQSNRDGGLMEIYVMNADGSGQTRLTNNSATDYQPAWSPNGSKILFVSDRDGNYEVYVMNADGTGQTNLTNNVAADGAAPQWSPDGTKIVFRSTRDGNDEIYSMTADGSGQTRLTNNSASDLYPSWQPPLRRVVFNSNRDGNDEIYSMNVDGTNLVRLTNNPASDTYARLSPDGSKIVFASNRDGNYEIYTMNADGTNQTRLTNNPLQDHYPAWSSNGSKIAFAADRDGNREVYVMNADGSGQLRLTNNGATDSQPNWSPDGTKLVFQSNRDGGYMEVYTMNADGSGQTRLTNNPATDYQAAWSPNGSKIAFTTDRDGNMEIYVMNADGTGQTNLTNNPAYDGALAAWSPDGRQIWFTSQRDGNSEIYKMNADGSGQTRMTNNSATDSQPSVGPAPLNNNPPTVTVSSPTNGTTFSSAPANITITASATDSDGTISKVEFFQGSTKLGEATASPYSFNWTNVSAGTYSITVKATDNGGATTISSAINITVLANQAPIANPGGPYSAPTNTSIQFNGTASSDPDGTISSYQWNFGDGVTGTGAMPIHAYSNANSYTLSLTVTDNSGATESATVRVEVTTSQPDLHINSVQIFPGNMTIKVGTHQIFAAVSYDNNGATLGGIAYSWWTNYSGQDGRVSISVSGDFVSDIAGIYTVTAAGAGHTAQVTVTVQAGSPSCTGICAEGGPDSGDDPNGWNPRNYKSAWDPINNVGNPPNRPEVGGSDSANFQLTLPLLSLAARGPGADLNLFYNSRVWTKTKPGDASEMTFDIDKGVPAPGWSFGFGKMINLVDGGAIIVDADGTRHGFTGEIRSTYQARKDFIGYATDATFVQYECLTDVYYRAGSDSGIAKYPNGIIIWYAGGLESSGARVLYPYQIQDANGNQAKLTYHNHTRPDKFVRKQLETITDTLGRVVIFHYDSDDLLTAITASGLKDSTGNATTRTLVRFHYKQLALDYAFSPMTTHVRSGTDPVSVIDAIYFPATSTGYWFGYPDSYSSYGMIRKVEQQKGMGFSTATNTPLNEQGTVTPGVMTAQQVYDYPLTKGADLSDAPQYHNLTQSWEGMSGAPVVTQFDVNNTSSPRSVSVTLPNGMRRVDYAYNIPEGTRAHANDGLAYQHELYDANNHLLRKTTLGWDQDVLVSPVNGPAPAYVEETDELGQTIRTEYTYRYFNEVREVREFDYKVGQTAVLLRKTVREFGDSAEYWNFLDWNSSSSEYGRPMLVNLVTDEKTYAGDGVTLISETSFNYDEDPNPYNNAPPGTTPYTGALVNTPGVIQHSDQFDPYAGTGFFWQQYWIRKRGNLTSVTRYADVNNPNSAITEKRRYDITGNLVSQSTACGQETSFVYELLTQYAYPVSQTRGSADPNALARVKTSVAYDFNTGLPLSTTDSNGRETTTTYYTDSLRPKEIISPTGARTSFEYDDSALKITQTKRISLNGPIAAKAVKYLNGIGQVSQEQALATLGVNGGNDVWDVVDTLYDQFGRLSMQSHPHRTGEAPQWNQTIYDAAGRVAAKRDPSGYGPTSVYNEATRPAGASAESGQTTKIIDAWGRWRWSRLNSMGQLAEVVEPNPAGGDGFRTKYSYDALGNLIKVEQGDQVRRFRYDSLARLRQQKLAEANATLNSAGEKATNEPENERWSEVFTYDECSNVISLTDARGVKTVLSYKDSSGNNDALGRLQSVSYDRTRVDSVLTVLPAATVNYQYRMKSSASQLIDVTKLKQVVANGVSTEDYEYDSEGRLHEKKLTFDGRSKAMTMTYEYDSLSRLSQITYPEQYHDDVTNPIRKVVKPSYDVASRVDGLKVNDVDYASQINYNAASQITSLLIGTGANQLSESYQYDPKSGLLTNQSVRRNGTSLMSLDYGYQVPSGCPPQVLCIESFPQGSKAYTGQITSITSSGATKFYSYDALGRLQRVDKRAGTFGYSPLVWSLNYSYDRYGNRTGSHGNAPGPQDGLDSLAYDTATNRITSPGFSYDAAGNQLQNNSGQSFIYDAAGRLVKVKDQSGTTLATYTYGASNHRLITQSGAENSTVKSYYVWEGDSVVTEYVEPSAASTMPQWSRNYIYLRGGLLASEEPNGSGAELVSYHHPDGLGTRLVTNNADTTFFEQVSLPFGTALDAESTGSTNRRFTSYDRSAATLLDYAVNRNYDSRQGRFTQVDPIGMGAVDLSNPQSLNLYAYCGNDPINSIDPSGTWGFGISFGGFPGFPGGPGAGPGGFWSGLFNFGAGLLSSIFGSSNGHIIGPPFLAFQTPAARVGPPAPKPAIVALAGNYSPDYEADNHEGSNSVFAARALESTRNRNNIEYFQNGAQIIDEAERLSNRVGIIGRLNIFGHSFPAGMIGYNNNSEGLYIGDPGNPAYHTQYRFQNGEHGLIPYLLSDETRRRGARMVEELAQAILMREINIANGGEIVFYGCFTDSIASHLAWHLKDQRPDIKVTGSNGSVSMERSGYAFTWGEWQWNTYAGHWLGTNGKKRMSYR